jgi:diguanylate cyclase (GGDEF)-like protein
MPGGRVLAVTWEPIAAGGWVCTYEDITVREAATARAVHLACHDSITNLPNRRALLDTMQIEWPQPDQYPFALLCIEIDRFQAICDTRGHSIGDTVLQQVADRLGSCVRRGDMLAHLGSASFALLMEAPASAEAAQRLAARLMQAVSEPLRSDGRCLTATLSIGIAIPEEGLRGPQDVLRNATLAMHRASAKGGARAKVYAVDMGRTAQAQHELELDLRSALQLGQFELHYQPLVSARDHVVTGFEALLRWRHPVRGIVSPTEFIPLAEQLGLIGPIGEWVLRTACAEAATWKRDVRVAVNLSPEQFAGSAACDLAATVARILDETGLPGTRLELEITESVRLQEDAATLDTLHALRRLGARISLDDFGTGYSSLSYLRCFPFDKIKIDQSFVRALPSPEAAAIVRAVAGLGASLGISTVAEGVETEAQLSALVAEQCDEMQGYLFSKPRPASEVPALIAASFKRDAG